MAFGDITYCKVYVDGTDIFHEEGSVSLDLGNVSQSNKSVSGGKGAYAVIDDCENSLYRDASITCLEGSQMQSFLANLYNTENYGSEIKVVMIKNNNRASTLATDRTIFKIRCMKNPGQRTGYAVTGNNDDTAYVTFGLELFLLSEAII